MSASAADLLSNSTVNVKLSFNGSYSQGKWSMPKKKLKMHTKVSSYILYSVSSSYKWKSYLSSEQQ